MQGAADRDEIEAADLSRKVLGPAFDQGEGLPCALRRRARGGEHGRLRIDADDAADIRRKAEREQPRAGSEIDQCVLFGKPQLLRDGCEKFGRIGRPQLLVQLDGSGEASHWHILQGGAPQADAG